MERIFLVLTFTAIWIFKYPFLLFLTSHFSLIHCPLLVTLIPVLSTAMIMYSSFNSLFLLSSFILISNLFILLCLLWYNCGWKVLFLSHGLVQFPLSVYKEDESMP